MKYLTPEQHTEICTKYDYTDGAGQIRALAFGIAIGSCLPGVGLAVAYVSVCGTVWTRNLGCRTLVQATA
jgi:hypothetical protein